MIIKYLLPLLALLGFCFASYTVVSSNQPMPVAQAVAEPAFAPFTHFIAGVGLVEPKSQNIAIGTPLARIVRSVAVKVGERVKPGTPLFYLDDRDTLAELDMRLADLAKAQAEVNVAQSLVTDAQSLYHLAEQVSVPGGALSREEQLKRRNALHIAQAKLASANALVTQAEAAVNNSQTTLERLVVRAPAAGQVLQVNVRPGEFAVSGVTNTPLLLLGNLDALHVRVDIDENDAWRFNKDGKAVAYLRGNRAVKVDLSLAYVEPYVVPKKSLTGDTTERVDTRVLQVLYRFTPQAWPIYVGQQMDVFIEAQDTPVTPVTLPASPSHG